MTPEDIQKLKDDIAEFDAYKNLLTEEQIQHPLDKTSQDVVHQDILVPTGNVLIPFSQINYNQAIEVNVNGKKYLLDTSSIYT